MSEKNIGISAQGYDEIREHINCEHVNEELALGCIVCARKKERELIAKWFDKAGVETMATAIRNGEHREKPNG